MKTQQTEKYIHIRPEKSFLDFFKSFKDSLNQYVDHNMILDCTDFDITNEELMQFTPISENKMEHGTSFVIIKSGVSIDEFPDELIIVPTLQEAEDLIDMDEMTRNLDF